MKKHPDVRLHSGFARRDVTPLRPCFLVGYPHVERTSTGVHDPLYASAVSLESAGTALILVSLDLLFVTREWTEECRQRISRATGVPERNILLAATHTHSGPQTASILAWRDDPVVPPIDWDILRQIQRLTVDAAIEAWGKRMPAEAAWTTSTVRGVAGGNRLGPEGAEDPEAGLLFLRKSEDAQPLAVVSIYGMHPTVLHEDSTLFSADFIGYVRRVIEDKYPEAGVVYLNGVCGDQSPRRAVTAQTFAEAERIGRALGERLVDALQKIEHFDSELSLDRATCMLPLEGKHFPSVEEAEKNLAAARATYARLQSEGAERATVRTAECTVFGAEEVLTLAKAEIDGSANALRDQYKHAEIQVLRIGQTHVAAWPGEFFVEYGLATKRGAPTPVHVVTMANGELQGYVVTPQAEVANGYESQMSLFPASTGERFVKATLELIEKTMA